MPFVEGVRGCTGASAVPLTRCWGGWDGGGAALCVVDSVDAESDDCKGRIAGRGGDAVHTTRLRLGAEDLSPNICDRTFTRIPRQRRAITVNGSCQQAI